MPRRVRLLHRIKILIHPLDLANSDYRESTNTWKLKCYIAIPIIVLGQKNFSYNRFNKQDIYAGNPIQDSEGYFLIQAASCYNAAGNQIIKEGAFISEIRDSKISMAVNGFIRTLKPRAIYENKINWLRMFVEDRETESVKDKDGNSLRK